MRFSLYCADSDFCDFLRKSDFCVPFTMDKKKTRPFVGIVLNINGFKYYAPLTSPKEKHKTMKDQIDFLKIKDGELGAINFNNMIPILDDCLKKVDLDILPTDTDEIRAYKNLLTNQISWCNETLHMREILAKAKHLYTAIVGNTASDNLKKRCCNFSLDEIQCKLYAKNIDEKNSEIARI